jgi:Domain of unknown function (DUF4430)
MTGRRGTAVASALLCAALAAAGCGLGPGADVGSVQLTVTREYGAVPVLDRSVSARESDTVMRVLEGEAEISTRYGGGYVRSIEGVAEAQRGGHPYDWFFYVDGVESPVGAAEYALRGGERVWWDYRDWSATNHVPAVVGSWPAPFADGIGGRPRPVVVECEDSPAPGSSGAPEGQGESRAGGGACEATRAALRAEGVEVASGSPDPAIRVLVGPWDRLRDDPAARLLEAGPAESGVFADFVPTGTSSRLRSTTPEVANRRLAGRYELVVLDEGGEDAGSLGADAGLVAATSRYGGPPVWVVTGGTASAVRAAADALDAEHLRDRYAVAIEGGKATSLPVEAR